MNEMQESRAVISEELTKACDTLYGVTPENASGNQLYGALAHVIKERLALLYRRSHERAKAGKQVYYLSMEFLVGRSMERDLCALGMAQTCKELLAEYGVDIEELYRTEPDPGLGNGGLGRLAACFLEAASTKALPFTGFSIKYEFGIFRQKIVDGWQVEFPDEWLEKGEVWLRARREDAIEVKFDGHVEGRFEEDGYKVEHKGAHTVIAIPHDLFVPGYGGEYCNVLTVWQATSRSAFDMAAFSRGEYIKALEEETMAEVISKVLYPADDHIEGKRLRLRQQYLLVSASIQSIIREHIRTHGDIRTLPEHACIHLNDTHPALAVPELMRLLLDESRLSWEDSWDIVHRTVTYTNHTVMSEAMERWDLQMYRALLPRIAQITEEIDKRTRAVYQMHYGNDRAKIEYMAVISGSEVRMVNLCLSAAHAVNGVSSLHSEILRTKNFRDYASLYPDRFCSVTNGIAYRRWLCIANPSLASLLDQTIGDAYRSDALHLKEFLRYRDDGAVLSRLRAIKHENKVLLANLIAQRNDMTVDPASVFDVQVKRLHEYKRQLLAALRILSQYLEIKDAPEKEYQPTTYIFAAKASSGYFMAKQILRLIVMLSRLIEADPRVRAVMRVVFLEDYSVTLAQRIIPAAELSEQISLAGKEASGTGNMKMMMNGAVTVGTMDGANVEIFEQVGLENGFLFGLDAAKVQAVWREGYRPEAMLKKSEKLRRVMDFLKQGFMGVRFDEIVASLLYPSYGQADPYLILADFDSYLEARTRADLAYRDSEGFSRMSLINIACSGVFSADRAIEDYMKRVWGIK